MKVCKKVTLGFFIFFTLLFLVEDAQALTCISCNDLDSSSSGPSSEEECEYMLRSVEGSSYRGIKQFDRTTYDCSRPRPVEEVTGLVLCPISPEVTFGGQVTISVPGETSEEYYVSAGVNIGSLDKSKCPLDTEGTAILFMQDSGGTAREITRDNFKVGPDFSTLGGKSLEETLTLLGKSEGETTKASVVIKFPDVPDYPLWTTDFALTKLNAASNMGTVTPSTGAAATMPYTFSATAPRLSIPLPTLPSLTTFTDFVATGDPGNRYLLIPWLGEYIAAIYKYAIGITGFLAGIMIVVAGLIWLTAGGSAERVSAAKSYIEGALVGLVIALTSYVLLYAINPKLTEFDAMKVRFIERVSWDQVDTATASLTAATDSSVPSGERPIATSQKCDESLSRCSITFSAEAMADTGTGPGNARAMEFFNKMKAVASSLPGTTRSKVIAVAEELADCCVIFGSCGETNLRVNYLAGVPQSVAGQRGKNQDEELKNGLGASTRGIVRHSVYTYQNQALWRWLDEMNCDADIENCSPATQINAVGERLRREIGDGYPDSWADELQRGDSIVIFNANSATRGGHAAIFMGWSSRAGVANLIQGSPGGIVKRGTSCLKTTCGRFYPFTSTYKPEP